MKTIVTFVCLVFGTCEGVISAPPLTVTDSGYYLTIVDSSGVPTLEKIGNVTNLRSGKEPPDVPDGPADPKPPKVELDLTVVTDSTAWSKAVSDPLTAQAVSLVYDTVLGAYQDGLVDGSTVWPVLKDATDAAIAIVGSGKDWATFRTKVSDLITLGRQKGTLEEKQAVLVVLNSLRQGLEMSADGTPSLSLAKAVEVATKTNGVIDDSRK